jgi:hypothetical protein
VTCLPANCYLSALALYKFGSACLSKTEFISIANKTKKQTKKQKTKYKKQKAKTKHKTKTVD